MQLTFDFSSSQRHRREVSRLGAQPLLFVSASVDLDVSLHSPQQAVATVRGDPDVARRWLTSVVGPVEVSRPRRLLFPTSRLDRLVSARPPARVTLDAASMSVARTLWATAAGYAPLVVRRHGKRLLASSPASWPRPLRIRDAPWTTVATLAHLGVALTVNDPSTAVLLSQKVADAGGTLARVGVAGSTVYVTTNQPAVVEQLGLPALAYAGPAGSGQYRLPLLAAEPLLHEAGMVMTSRARRQIEAAMAPVQPLTMSPDFPWTLYPFQARDAARAVRILQATGGVLLAGEMGSGKALRDDTIVVAEHGLVPIGRLRQGDRVQGSDGGVYKVRGVYPQGVRPLIELRVEGVGSVWCDREHRWPVRVSHRSGRFGTGARPWEVVAAETIVEHVNRGIEVQIPVGTIDGSGSYRFRRVESVHEGGAAPAVCIETASPDGLFMLAGGLLTHNTTVSLALADHLDLFPLLVTAPLSAFSTWARQLDEMGKRFIMATGPTRHVWAELEAATEFDAVVMSYDRLHAFVELLETIEFRAIIADELQKTSSPGSRRSRALRQLAQHLPVRIGLSGTPMNNYLTDLLPIGSFLVPSEWKPRATSKDLSDVYPGDPVEAVADHLGSMMVRRRIDDVGVTLPDKHTRRVYVRLTVEQRRALEELRVDADRAVDDGEVERMHVFARLQRMRQVISSPSAVGVPGPNPKVDMAVDLAEQFSSMGRKTVLFAVNRQGWIDLGVACDQAGLGWVGVWGSTPVPERIAAERRFHDDPQVRCFIGTVQSCAEAITLSPTGSVAIFTGYVYNPSQAAQAEARIYRLNQTNDVDIIYLHAQAPGGTLDDRFVEILEQKRALISQVVDRRVHVDDTKVHYSTGDLVFLLTGHRDERLDQIEQDKKAEESRMLERRRHAKASAHRRKYREVVDVDLVDDGTFAELLNTDDAEGFDVDTSADDRDSDGVQFDRENPDDPAEAEATPG